MEFDEGHTVEEASKTRQNAEYELIATTSVDNIKPYTGNTATADHETTHKEFEKIDVPVCLERAVTEEITTPSREFKRLKRFLLPPPRYDPHKLLKESDIPEMVVNSLMIRVKERNSTMSYLRGVCYPASLWILYRELNNTSQVRRLLIMGWTKEVVDGAREIIYDFIKYEIGVDI